MAGVAHGAAVGGERRRVHRRLVVEFQRTQAAARAPVEERSGRRRGGALRQ
jgi:hypothetical protein